MRGFRGFLERGNVVDLAVAVVIGVAFTAVVNSFVKDLVTPLIGAIGGQPDFSRLYFTINNSKFLFGDFLNAAISFLVVAAVIYFFVVTPYTALMARTRKQPSPATKKCPECLSEIPLEARRCAFCGELVAPHTS